MTASTLTHLLAREHINDLQREAHLHRLAAELRAARRVWLKVARRVARAATA